MAISIYVPSISTWMDIEIYHLRPDPPTKAAKWPELEPSSFSGCVKPQYMVGTME